VGNVTNCSTFFRQTFTCYGPVCFPKTSESAGKRNTTKSSRKTTGRKATAQEQLTTASSIPNRQIDMNQINAAHTLQFLQTSGISIPSSGLLTSSSSTSSVALVNSVAHQDNYNFDALYADLPEHERDFFFPNYQPQENKFVPPSSASFNSIKSATANTDKEDCSEEELFPWLYNSSTPDMH
jgi:hypothetical protein